MTIFLTILAFFVALYGVIWCYLLYGYFRQQKQAYDDFVSAWDTNTYTTTISLSSFDSVLHIKFPSGNGMRYVAINEDGSLSSAILWEASGRDSTKPSRFLKNKLEEYTKQIATMYKLENGGFAEKEEWS